MTTNAKHTPGPWTLVATLRGAKGDRGHRIFRAGDDPTNLAIADNSGADPDRTDDGPLWLEGTATVDDSRIRFVLEDGYHTADELTEENLAAVTRLGIVLTGTTWLGRLAVASLQPAAPELLEALRGIVAWQNDPNKDTPSWERRLREARAAIAKAEGR